MTDGLYEKNSLPFFFKLYKFTLYDFDLTGRELIIYTYLLYQMEIFNKRKISYGEIAKEVNIKRQNVIACIRNLVGKKLIQVEKGSQNSYSFLLGGEVVSNQDQLITYLVSKRDQEWSQNKTRASLKIRPEVVSKRDHIKDNKEFKEIKENQKEDSNKYGDTNKYEDADFDLGLGENDFEF